MSKQFEKQYTFQERFEKCNELKLKFPDRIPIIVEKSSNSKLKDLEKKKYLVPKDFSVGQFLFTLRKMISLKPEEAVFIYVKKGKKASLLNTSSLLSNIYNMYQSDDGFLYFVYDSENTFG